MTRSSSAAASTRWCARRCSRAAAAGCGFWSASACSAAASAPMNSRCPGCATTPCPPRIRCSWQGRPTPCWARPCTRLDWRTATPIRPPAFYCRMAAIWCCRPSVPPTASASIRPTPAAAGMMFLLLGNELWRIGTARALATAACQQGPHALCGFFGQALTPARAWLSQAFGSDLVGALLAPWVLHCGLGPDAPLSALMAKVVAFALEAVGMPLVQGGNANTVRAFERLIRAAGGELETGADVERVLVERGCAAGVRLADGREYRARDVICNVTPTQLYQRLLDPAQVPAEIAAQARQWRYGKGNLQIHLALSQPPRWPDAALDRVGYLHLTSGADAVSRAVNEAERGLLPAEPTICVAQPTALDPSRAPEGRHILWIQLPECPREPVGDAAGLIAVPAGARWTTPLREAYAERVIERLARQVPNLQDSLLARAVLSPTDLEGLNMNLVGGDPYGGDCSLDQSFLWRPLRAARNHETHLAHLWHIGASTRPGPGLGGGSGLHLAKALGAA